MKRKENWFANFLFRIPYEDRALNFAKHGVKPTYRFMGLK